MEGQVQDWKGCGYTCHEKDGNDQILKKIGITCLGMAHYKWYQSGRLNVLGISEPMGNVLGISELTVVVLGILLFIRTRG